MSVFNLGVVFGPTLLRPLEETVAAILDIKFNNIVINILIENYERIFKNDPSSAVTATAPGLHGSSTSPPTRMPRASQVSKANSALGTGGGTAGGGSVGRNSMYSPQQKVFRVVAKSNYTDPTMSSSLQNIPNGMIYAHGPASVTNSTPPGGGGGGGGGGGAGNPSNTNGGISGSTLTVSSHATNGAARPAQMGSMKNLLAMTQSDIGGRRSGASSDAAAVYGILTGTSGPGGGGGGGGAGGGSTNGGGAGGGVGGAGVALQAHHATPATAGNSSSLRHVDYLMATATPVAQSSSSSHIYTNAGSTRHSINNVSPPTAAMRKERLLQSSGSSSAIAASGPQQHPPVQRSHFGYGQAKHYSPVAAASTSSSNESVCDSLSSNNGAGAGAGAGGGGGGGVGSGGGLISGGSSANVTRLLNARSSIDYPPITSQTSSLSTLLGSTCDDIVTATAAPSMIGGAGGIGSLSGSGSTNESADYAPTKMHRNRDINQIKRDLSAGTA